MIAVERRPRVLVVHPQQLVGKALCRLLIAEHALDVIGDARSVEEAKLGLVRPDLLLLDFDGCHERLEGCIATCKAASPATRIMLLTVHAAQAPLQRSLACGVEGFVLTDIEPDELRFACKTVADGKLGINARTHAAVYAIRNGFA